MCFDFASFGIFSQLVTFVQARLMKTKHTSVHTYLFYSKQIGNNEMCVLKSERDYFGQIPRTQEDYNQ